MSGAEMLALYLKWIQKYEARGEAWETAWNTDPRPFFTREWWHFARPIGDTKAGSEAAMGDKTRGLYNKYTVIRNDGTDGPGGKHVGCQYFVLDVTHDEHAKAALAAYAKSCEADYPLLARDVLALLEENMNFGEGR